MMENDVHDAFARFDDSKEAAVRDQAVGGQERLDGLMPYESRQATGQNQTALRR